MSADNIPNITEEELSRLERRVDELILTCGQLKEENESLRAKQESLVSERATLIERNELARNRVEAMITRLKSMEYNA